ncbi:MAG: BlaI/MecI/CopY family transcriptional regulator [Blautia wexlerae]
MLLVRNCYISGLGSTNFTPYLTRLVKKGILHSEGKGYKCKRSYYPELTERELALYKYATDFVDNTFNGSISDLLVFH